MKKISQIDETLVEMGRRLRAQRLARNDTMAIFAQRLSVSEQTVRAMERGAPAVQIGTWLQALWTLDRLDDMQLVLEIRESLFDRELAPPRQRASRRRR